MRARSFFGIGIVGTVIIIALILRADILYSNDTYGVLLNHHTLEPKINLETIAAIPDKPYDVIVLIAPNHFSRGYGPITTTKRLWNTPSGTLPSSASLVEMLFRDTQVFLDDAPFEREHGITVPLHQIATRFSNIPVIPIIVKDGASFDNVIEFAAELDHVLPRRALIVGSFDFAHDIPSAVAQFHDELSKEMILTADTRAIFNQADVDSRPGLALLVELLRLRGSSQFKLQTNTNVGNLMKQPWTKENVSYVTGVFHPGTPASAQNIETTLWVSGAATTTWANNAPRMRYGQNNIRFLGVDDPCVYGTVRKGNDVQIFATPFENFQWTSREKFSTIECNIHHAVFYEN